MTIEKLKEKVAELEKQLTAMDTLQHLCESGAQASQNHIDPSDIAHLLDHLIEPAMYQVEAMKELIDELSKQTQTA